MISRLGSKLVKGESGEGGVVGREAEDAISFLRERRDFWGQFKPMYVNKKTST